MPKKNPFKLEVVSIRLVKDAPLFSDHKLTTPQDAAKVVGDFLCEMDREVLCVVNLKSDGTPINCSIVSIGAVNQTIAEPRELFKAAILSNAAQMLMMHNHPSGSLEPSRQDIVMTDRMLELSELMGIRLVDHIIVGNDSSRYFSFREKQMIEYPTITFRTDYNDLNFRSIPAVAEKGKAR